MKRLYSMAQSGVLAAGLLVSSSFAQAPVAPVDPDPTMPRQTDVDDNDFNLGWLGMLGLAGLLGLRKRPHSHTHVDDVRHTGTDRT